MQQGAAWLHDIAYILEPALPHALRGEQVAAQLRGYLDTLRLRPEGTPTFYGFALHLHQVSRSYWPGLFHCYDVPGLARTNNQLESPCRVRTAACCGRRANRAPHSARCNPPVVADPC